MVFHRVWKNANKEKLKELRKNNTWMDLEVWLCDACFYKFAETQKPFEKEQVKVKGSDEEDAYSSPSPAKSRTSYAGTQAAFQFGLKMASTKVLPTIKFRQTAIDFPQIDQKSDITQRKPLITPAERMYENLVPRSITYKTVNSSHQAQILSQRQQASDKISAISKDDTTIHDSTVSKHVSAYGSFKISDRQVNLKKSVIEPNRPKPGKKSQSFGKVDLASIAKSSSQSSKQLDYLSCMGVLKNSHRYRNAFVQ